jgi:hypothetical protein
MNKIDQKKMDLLKRSLLTIHEKFAPAKKLAGRESRESLESSETEPDDSGAEIADIITKVFSGNELCDLLDIKPIEGAPRN